MIAKLLTNLALAPPRLRSVFSQLSASLLAVFFCGIAFSANGQVVEISADAISGQLLELPVQSLSLRPTIVGAPQHGSAVFRSTGVTQGSRGLDYVEYVSNANFFGRDTIIVQRWEGSPFPMLVTNRFVIQVLPSVVIANDDQFIVAPGGSSALDVLANDSASFIGLAVQEIASAQGGSATIGASDITFSPKPGFEGLAYIRYVACDLLGECDDATATILVGRSSSPDTIVVTTTKGTAVTLFVDESGAQVTNSPSSGILQSGLVFPSYQPNAGFTGSDEIWWSFPDGESLVALIDVIDVNAGNAFAIDDQAYISVNTVAFIDVLENDNGGSTLAGLSLTSQPTSGTASVQQGVVRYTPNAGFSGVDEFTYRVFPAGFLGPAEEATVQVLVSNLQPDLFAFDLATPKNTPLVVAYPIALTNYSFGIDPNANLAGTTGYFPQLDSVVRGYPLFGERLILYNPPQDFVGTETIQASYCITSTGACVGFIINVTVEDLTPPANGWCVQECVWPGDTDNNGVVNVADILPIGVCHGKTGVQRTGSSMKWRGVEPADWGNTFDPNIGYVDTDGDGIIADQDTAAIVANLGRFHQPYTRVPKRLGQLPLFIALTEDTLYAGDLATFDVILGTTTNYAVDVYGFAFDVNYATGLITPGSERLRFLEDSWLSYGSPTLSLNRRLEPGLIAAATTKTDGIARTGYGRVAQIDFIIDEDIIGFRPQALMAQGDGSDEILGEAVVSLSGPSVATATGGYELAQTQVSVPVVRRRPGMELRDQDLKVFPNPAHEQVRVHLNGADQIDLLELIDPLGRIVERFIELPQSSIVRLDELPLGVYTLRATAGTSTVQQRIVRE